MRLNRFGFWWRMILINIPAPISAVFSQKEASADMKWIIPLAIAIVAWLLSVRWIVRRFHDIDRSGYFWFALFIPIYNIYLWILLLFLRGTRGQNRFGADPLV